MGQAQVASPGEPLHELCASLSWLENHQATMSLIIHQVSYTRPSKSEVLSYSPGEVPWWLDISSNAEVPGPLLEERVYHALGLGPLHGQGRRCHLLPLLSLFGDHCSSAITSI